MQRETAFVDTGNEEMVRQSNIQIKVERRQKRK